MPEKHGKIFMRTTAVFLVFLCAGFMFSAIKASASGLEVDYPNIGGYGLEAGSELPAFAFYLFNAGMFIGFSAAFLSLIVGGVMYFFSSLGVNVVMEARDRITGAISGLLILTFTYLIVTTINPQLAIFKLNKISSPPQTPPAEKKASGVYFYSSTGCPDASLSQISALSISDFDRLKNKIRSANIVHGSAEQYVSVVYDAINFQGKCQYINPNENCDPQELDFLPASASIHEYNWSPDGDGVYFYRKTCFNNINKSFANKTALLKYCEENSGGYAKIDNAAIKSQKIYVGKLEDIKFSNVPENEQDCKKYNEAGGCEKKVPPSLGGENISSIIINGKYAVMLIYFDPVKDSKMSWSFCQEYPGTNDINKLGPIQIKWDSIRNKQQLPNYVVILPIKD